MIKTARQLKDLIRNLSKEKSADAQILMRNYMMERVSRQVYLKGWYIGGRNGWIRCTFNYGYGCDD